MPLSFAHFSTLTKSKEFFFLEDRAPTYSKYKVVTHYVYTPMHRAIKFGPFGRGRTPGISGTYDHHGYYLYLL